jgi:hypothetical protein
MRKLSLFFLILLLGGCQTDKYASAPRPTGPWLPANADPTITTGNNIVPYDEETAL